jgi:hypothetical protein
MYFEQWNLKLRSKLENLVFRDTLKWFSDLTCQFGMEMFFILTFLLLSCYQTLNSLMNFED